MTENVEVTPEAVSTAEHLVTSSGEVTNETASKVNEASARQDESKWTDLSETSTAQVRSQKFMATLADRMREAAEVAERYAQLLTQTHEEFQALDEAAQQQMADQFAQLDERTGLRQYEQSFDPYRQRQQLIEKLRFMPQFIRSSVFSNDEVLASLLPGSTDAERAQVREVLQRENPQYSAIDEYHKQQVQADTSASAGN
ncbi:hypothetical protein [uncultured Gulosibacter sp.]|uniref:hypothetical protein n=1 Tax=uncultured Gulosibacter sp. TaxID=1339167 RepID=UPI00288B9903|nr:hypothetical protein [uncultured Gulosibacter sp.]